VTPKPVHPGTRPSIRFRLSTAATVTLRIAKPGTHRTLTVTAHQGANRIRLARKVTSQPGRYRVVATAIDTNGQHSNRAIARFTAIH
jgi:hypothetical protein